MPGVTALQPKSIPARDIVFYSAAVIAIVLTVYYMPNYFFLERSTAEHASLLLNLLGVDVQAYVYGESAFLADIRIVRDCTGVQVMAVFLGLLLPLPHAPWRKKLLALATVVACVYAANLLRIALEFWLVYFEVLPWRLAHYPLSLLLGVIGVALLVVITDRTLPEFGSFLITASKSLRG